MSVTPSADAQAIATAQGNELAALATPLTGLQAAIASGSLAPAASVDPLLTIGYQAMNDAVALGTASTSSPSFGDVGNGLSTGFSSWTTPAITVAKTYVIWCRLSCYATTGGGLVSFQLLVDGVAPAGQPTSAQRIFLNSTLQQFPMFFGVPVSLAATTHIIKLQWKVSGTAVAQVDSNDGRTFWLTG
jgi:hypothetical protein